MEDIAAVDIGFGWLNAVSGSRELRAPSVVGESRPLFDGINKSQALSVWWQDRELFVGEHAIRQSDTRYFSLREEKAANFTSEVLLLAALGYLAQGTAEFSLVTGLPVDFYFQQRASMDSLIERYRESHIRMTIGEQSVQSRTRIVRHKVVPQPLGGLMAVVLNQNGEILDKELAKKTILVIDVGTYTMNLLAISGMEIIQPLSRTMPLGLAAAYKPIARDLGGLPLYEVDHRIRQGRLSGYESALQALAAQQTLEIEGLNYAFDLYLIVGGGGERVAPWLLPGRNTELVPDAQGAVARGYRNLGARLWRKRTV